MEKFNGAGVTLRGVLATTMLTLALGLVASSCGQLDRGNPPYETRKTEIDLWVNNITVPGAPKNTAYPAGEAEMVAHVRGSGGYVAFYIPPGIGNIWVRGSQGMMQWPIAGEKYTFCEDNGYKLVPCPSYDGWVYMRVEHAGHAKVLFTVGYHVGYYDVLARPVLNMQKLEYEARAKVYFSRDFYDGYGHARTDSNAGK